MSVTENSSAPCSSWSSIGDRGAVARVLARVLQRLEAAEVDRGLDLLRVPADLLGLDRRGQRGAVAGGAERVGQPAVHQQRRVDAVREVAQLLHRLLEVGRDLVEHLLGGVGVGVGELAGEAGAHRERDEVLLRAVVQVALDAAALEVGGLDDAGAGAAQLVGLAPDLVERVLERGVELEVVQREARPGGPAR